MKTLQKLSILSFLFCLFPLTLHAIEPIDDEEMGDITGQDGLVNIAIKTEGEYEHVTWYDTEGEASLKNGKFSFETVNGAIGIGFDKNAKNEDVLRFEIPELAVSASTSGSIGADGKSIGRFNQTINFSGATLYVKGH